jgi:hypothetical protein
MNVRLTEAEIRAVIRYGLRDARDPTSRYCSGYADMTKFEEDIGLESILKKPFTGNTLAAAVRDALRTDAAHAADTLCHCGAATILGRRGQNS